MNAITKVSEITYQDIADYIRLDEFHIFKNKRKEQIAKWIKLFSIMDQ